MTPELEYASAQLRKAVNHHKEADRYMPDTAGPMRVSGRSSAVDWAAIVQALVLLDRLEEERSRPVLGPLVDGGMQPR